MHKILKNKAVLKNCKIYRMLVENGKKRHVSFHTPGHKNAKWDITELAYSDNLSCPTGCLAEAERDVAAILGAHQSFLMTDGSTSGVLSMLYAAKTLGVKRVLACVDTHKSFFNGCQLLQLTPLLYPAKREGGIPRPYTLEELQTQFPNLLEEADAVFVTSPDYYGNVTELSALRAYCDKTKKTLLADGAHGGHLHYNKTTHAGAYADMWVDGVHKSLPALTQGSVVSASSERFAAALKTAVDIFRTTSPSYPIMASVEYAVKYPENKALEESARNFAAAHKDRVYLAEDWTKLCAVFGDNAFAVEKEMQKLGIYPEFCDGNLLMFYLSPATENRAFAKLKKSLVAAFEKYPYKRIEKGEKDVQRIPAPHLFNEMETEWVPFDRANGRICARICGLFPPCTPLLFIGEEVTNDKLALLQQASNVFGVQDASILVYKK